MAIWATARGQLHKIVMSPSSPAAGPRVAIIAALEQEVRLLVKSWKRTEWEHQGRRFCFFESGQAVAVCGGIGAEGARRATEAVIAFYHPREIWTVGFAGALLPGLKAGALFLPELVIDAGDGSRAQVNADRPDEGSPEGTLVTFHAVADAGQKTKLGKAYGAQAVDMEAAAVARGAQKYDLPFRAVKVISDEAGFAMPDLSKFVTPDGRVQVGRAATFAMVRPWLWRGLIRLGVDSRRGARVLCAWLAQNLQLEESK